MKNLLIFIVLFQFFQINISNAQLVNCCVGGVCTRVSSANCGFAGGAVVGGSSCFPDPCNSLPVELTTFEATINNTKEILLNWETLSEESNEGFYIQKSKEGDIWENIDFVEGHGTTLEKQVYTFLDENPFSGLNYYRLKQIDFDGQFEYSKIASVGFQKTSTNDFVLYPNPTTSTLIVNYSLVTETNSIKLYTIQGQLLKDIPIQESGESQVDLSDFPMGVYLIRINDIYTKRVVKL